MFNNSWKDEPCLAKNNNRQELKWKVERMARLSRSLARGNNGLRWSQARPSPQPNPQPTHWKRQKHQFVCVSVTFILCVLTLTYPCEADWSHISSAASCLSLFIASAEGSPPRSWEFFKETVDADSRPFPHISPMLKLLMSCSFLGIFTFSKYCQPPVTLPGTQITNRLQINIQNQLSKPVNPCCWQ